MAGTLYALMVGINQYEGDVPDLNGCVNDVRAMQAFLQERTAGGQYKLALRTLTSGGAPDEEKPTRQNVLRDFQSHLGQAGEGDVALFYYSGHGSQEQAPPQFWGIEPDHLDETLVMCDSRTPGSWDLADKELAVLIHALAEKKPHVVVILDACHSGSGTRALVADGTRVRLAPVDARERPLDSFLPGVIPSVEAQIARGARGRAKTSATGDWFSLPRGRHVVISACQAEESAREKTMPNGQTQGVLTYFLLDTLRQVGPTQTYRDVFNRANSLVRNQISDQRPVIAASDSRDLKRPFLGGAIVPQAPYYDVYQDSKGQWRMRAGAIHGIAQPVGAETTQLALFAATAIIEMGASLEQALGSAQVIEVSGSTSSLQIEMENGQPPQADAYKAVVVATPLPPVAVFLDGDDQPALQRLRDLLQQSLIVRPAASASDAVMRVSANQAEQNYRLQRTGDRQPLHVSVPDKASSAAAKEALARLEHMAQWMQLLTLDNTQSQLPPDAVRMDFYDYNPLTDESTPLPETGEIRLRYDPRKDQEVAHLQIRLEHTGQVKRPLYCMLVDLSEDFSVIVDNSLFGAGVWLQPGQSVWASNENGKPYIEAFIQDELFAQGVTSIQDTIKLIISTDETEAGLLAQDSLEVVTNTTTRGLRSASKAGLPDSSLHRLMNRFTTRGVGSRPKKDSHLSDWRTTQRTLITQALGAGAAIPASPQQEEQVADGVRVQGHAGFKARVELLGFEEGKRDVGNLALPAIFRHHPEIAEPFNLRPSRGGNTGQSVIVLNEVQNRLAVTRDTPLVFHADAHLKEGEALLPVAWDKNSELFLPLGIGYARKGEVEIRIDRLPPPTSDSRDVAGSIKLFVQKVLAEKIGLEKFGLEANTHRLAIATRSPDGRILYDDSPIALKAQVAQAQRILLYIHGFTGDTRDMVSSAYGLKQPPATPLANLIDSYDLLLAFDYENFNTSIEISAQKLKAALLAIGLGPNHGKTVHIIAHSLGTILTRCFIERENGNKIVQKAVLVGPPNAGTPWAKVEDYLVIGLGAALNGLAALAWPVAAIPVFIGGLSLFAGGIEKMDTTLDELKPDSDLYKKLNTSDDPHVPYIIVAGNTTKMIHNQPDASESNKLKKLAQRLTSAETRNRLASLAFFNQSNDFVISMKSMTGLPEGRTPQARLLEAACDHITYFNLEAGLRLIVEGILEE